MAAGLPQVILDSAQTAKVCSFSADHFHDALRKAIVAFRDVNIKDFKSLPEDFIFSGDHILDSILWLLETEYVHHECEDNLYFFIRTAETQRQFFLMARECGKNDPNVTSSNVFIPPFGCIVIYNGVSKLLPVCNLTEAINDAIEWITCIVKSTSRDMQCPNYSSKDVLSEARVGAKLCGFDIITMDITKKKIDLKDIIKLERKLTRPVMIYKQLTNDPDYIKLQTNAMVHFSKKPIRIRTQIQCNISTFIVLYKGNLYLSDECAIDDKEVTVAELVGILIGAASPYTGIIN